MTQTPLLFTTLLIISFTAFAWGVWSKLGLLSCGQPENRFDKITVRIKEMLLYAFAQKRVLGKPFGINHFVIFWSFLLLLAYNIEFLVNGVFPSISFTSLPDFIYYPFIFMVEIVSFLAFIAVIIAAVRRVISPPYPEAITAEAFFILFLIAMLMLANFGLNASKVASMSADLVPIATKYMFFSGILANLIPVGSSNAVHTVSWWTHAVALLLFIAYLPNSKHMHILTAIPNCFFRRFEAPNTQPREEFVKGNLFGVGQVDQFTWKDLLDSFACTECGRCQQVCPASITGKPLNPRSLVHDIKVNLQNNGALIKSGQKPEQCLIGTPADGSISEKAIWGCTTCGACMEACPVFIEQMPKIIKMRRYLVETEADFPEELLNLFENMEGRSNPWGIAPSERTKWSSQMAIKQFDSDTEYLLYVGCAGSFDSRSKHVTIALAQLLDKAGLSWGILGKDEKCCGDSARRLGNEYLFDLMAKENIRIFQERGVKKIITQCPHCFSTIKNDYHQYGLELEVIHHSQLLDDLVKKGLLKPQNSVTSFGSTLFHDSCYLGRHNNIYDAPRKVIKAATGKAPAEMERNRNNAFCCGAGGGRMWMEEHDGERINLARVKEALQEKPDTICVSCPYCLTMFEDGLKDLKTDGVKVLDFAEVLAEAVLRD